MYICMYISVCMYLYVFIYTRMYVFIYINIFTGPEGLMVEFKLNWGTYMIKCMYLRLKIYVNILYICTLCVDVHTQYINILCIYMYSSIFVYMYMFTGPVGLMVEFKLNWGTYMIKCMYICMYMSVCMYLYVFICIHLYTYVCVYIYKYNHWSCRTHGGIQAKLRYVYDMCAYIYMHVFYM
jgi:hypothetical protein